jgi:hypothetical protein
MNRIPLVAIVFTVAAMAARAEEFNSDRPGIADGAETVGRGRVQLEAGFQHNRRKPGDEPSRETFLPTLLRIGVADEWEARVEGDLYSWMRDSQGGHTEGWAPFAIGVKHQFREGDGVGPSLGAIVSVSPPSGSGSLRQRSTTGEVRLLAEWELAERWSFNPNIGFGYEEDDEGERFSTRTLAATLAYRPQTRLELALDVGVQRPETPGGHTAVLSSASVAYKLKRELQVDFAFGGRSAGSTLPHRFVAAGFSARF